MASDSRFKSAGVVPGFMIRLGDGADSFGADVGLAGCDGAWPQLAGWFEPRAAQVLQQPQAVRGHGQAAPPREAQRVEVHDAPVAVNRGVASRTVTSVPACPWAAGPAGVRTVCARLEALTPSAQTDRDAVVVTLGARPQTRAP